MEKPINIKNAITLLYISLGLGLLQVFIILSSSIYRAYFGIGNTIPLALFCQWEKLGENHTCYFVY